MSETSLLYVTTLLDLVAMSIVMKTMIIVICHVI